MHFSKMQLRSARSALRAGGDLEAAAAADLLDELAVALPAAEEGLEAHAHDLRAVFSAPVDP